MVEKIAQLITMSVSQKYYGLKITINKNNQLDCEGV